MKKLWFVLLLPLLPILKINGQDVIVEKDGTTIISKVIEVNPTDVKYKKHSNLNGPTYTILKSDIQAINYENGERDVFNKKNTIQKTSENGPELITPEVSADNISLIEKYNQDNHYIKKSSSKTHWKLFFVHVGKESVLKNSDVEISLVRATSYIGVCNIVITNLTDRTIFVDLGNSFVIYPNGEYDTFFANTVTQKTTGSSKDVGFNVGSLTSALGIGGIIGNLAGGTVVGKGKMESTSTIEFKERIIFFPPHSKYLLDRSQYFNSSGRMKVGEERSYSEANTPHKKDYIFTYSYNQQFNQLSSIKFSLFLAKEIGCRWVSDYAAKITGFNENTLVDCTYESK